ncbi:MAG: hypothetical protein COA86_00630 [Kangiella sp.]|nr:MAG: hypothetical protein COA86_00630 [Kangiella sp.]
MQRKNSKKIDWRIKSGIVISITWILMMILLLFKKMSWQNFMELPLDQIEGFLTGAFSPLAIIWLIIGFFIQQQEIAENSRNIEQQAEHSNLDNFLKMSEIVYRHLAVISGYLYISCLDEIQESLKQEIDLDDKWAKSANGDYGIFARGLVRYRFFDDGNQRAMTKIFFGTEIRQNHINNYKRIFEGLLIKAKNSDCTGSLYESLTEGTIWGILYRMIKETEQEQAIKHKND